MYKRRKSNAQTSFSQRKTNQQRPSGGFSRFPRRRRTIKKLDERMFIRKAQPVKTSVKEEVKTVLFTSFDLEPKLMRNISEHGYTQTTPIQAETIPHLLQGRDVIGIANTGTGKTAAFLIPLVQKAYRDRNERVIIVTPTRELAMQIADELKAFTVGMNLESMLCIGGADMNRQIKKLKHNPHFVIGTPGRLKDLIERKKLQLFQFRNIVLDEVDRMVDIGFINDVKLFVSLLPKKRQSLFFSATITDNVRSILDSFVTNAVQVSVRKQETNDAIEQDIVRVKGDKIATLHNLLIQNDFEKVIVFGRTKWGINKLEKALLERGFKTAAIHGNKTQGQRQRALDAFKKGHVSILLATDVASRGIHIDNVSHVINFDAPESYDDYIHRIGRTGRAGNGGVALTFVE